MFNEIKHQEREGGGSGGESKGGRGEGRGKEGGWWGNGEKEGEDDEGRAKGGEREEEGTGWKRKNHMLLYILLLFFSLAAVNYVSELSVWISVLCCL